MSIPACVRSATCIGRGTGTELEPVENDLAGMAVLLEIGRASCRERVWR